jgi:hypothetical protein
VGVAQILLVCILGHTALFCKIRRLESSFVPERMEV